MIVTCDILLKNNCELSCTQQLFVLKIKHVKHDLIFGTESSVELHDYKGKFIIGSKDQ